MTFGQKIAICAIFVFIRADEYHKTLTDVLRKVSVSNVGFLKTPKFHLGDLWGCVMSQHCSALRQILTILCVIFPTKQNAIRSQPI